MSGKKTTPKQNRAIVALMSEPTLERAGLACGVHDRTLARWLKDPTFQEALARAEAEAISEAARSLSAASREAVAYLRQVLQDDEISPSEKIRACGLILGSLPPLRILGSIEERLEQLQRSERS